MAVIQAVNSSKDSPWTVPTCPPAMLGFSHSLKPPTRLHLNPSPRGPCTGSLRQPLQVDSKPEGRFTQQPSRSLAVLRALSPWCTFVRKGKRSRHGQVHKMNSLEAKAESKWGSKKCIPSLGLPVAFTFPSETPCPPLHGSTSEQTVNEVLDFTTWLKDTLQGQWCSVRQLLAKNQLACCECPSLALSALQGILSYIFIFFGIKRNQ